MTALPAGTNNIGDVDVLRIAAGTNYIGKVRLTHGTNDANLSTTGALFIGGAVAHDGIDSGNPVKLGMRALAHGTNPTAVAAADRTDWLANRAGIPWVIGGHPNVVTSGLLVADSDNAQTNLAIGPGTIAGGTKIVVTRISVMASNANTVNTACKIGFGTASVPADSARECAEHHPQHRWYSTRR